jgi:hypothetical protein
MSAVRENSDPAPTEEEEAEAEEEEEERKPAGENKEEQAQEWKDLMGLDLQMKVSCSQATSYSDILCVLQTAMRDTDRSTVGD